MPDTAGTLGKAAGRAVNLSLRERAVARRDEARAAVKKSRAGRGIRKARARIAGVRTALSNIFAKKKAK